MSNASSFEGLWDLVRVSHIWLICYGCPLKPKTGFGKLTSDDFYALYMNTFLKRKSEFIFKADKMTLDGKLERYLKAEKEKMPRSFKLEMMKGRVVFTNTDTSVAVIINYPLDSILFVNTPVFGSSPVSS